MAHLIEADKISTAWVAAMDHLLHAGGKAVNLNVAFDGGQDDDAGVRAEVERFLAEVNEGTDKDIWGMQTVANTIFPEALYYPHLGKEAAPRLYENYALSMRLQRQDPNPYNRETYFNRLVAYPVADGTWNQLEHIVGRLARQAKKGHLSSEYELGLSHPLDAELRLQAPGKDKRFRWFPCLSQISLTLVEGRVSMTALYRNQGFITRAYGNYLGLTRLLRFIATETTTEPGEVEVVATHADAELGFGKRAVTELVERCRVAITGPESVPIGA